MSRPAWTPEQRRGEEPWGWSIQLRSGERIMVHKRIRLDGWFLSAHWIGIADHALSATTAEGAQIEAFALLRARLTELREAVITAQWGEP